MQTTRDRWTGLVRRWRQSGLTTRRFAESAGVNPSTLTYWAWRLKRETKRRRPGEPRPPRTSEVGGKFVEVVARLEGERFELELGNGRRLLIPSSFDPVALERLLAVLAR